MKPRIYRRHPLNMHLGRASIAEGVSKQNLHPFKVMQKTIMWMFFTVMCISHMHPTLLKAIGYVTGVEQMLCCKHQLPSMTSKCSLLGKRLMIYWRFSSTENQRNKESIRLECNPFHD